MFCGDCPPERISSIVVIAKPVGRQLGLKSPQVANAKNHWQYTAMVSPVHRAAFCYRAGKNGKQYDAFMRTI